MSTPIPSHPEATADPLTRSGCISGFRDIIRRLQSDLRDEFFHFPQGNTDSEWAFACFLEQLARLTDAKARTICHSLLRKAMLETVALINKYTREAGVMDPSLMK